MRLTKNEPQENSMFPYQLKDDELRTRLDAIHKLGQLEDIENKIGIDLVTLFRALRNGIYIKPNNIYVGSPYLCFAENENRELEFQFKIVDTWYKVKDYGKTWTLTGEELEK